LSVSEQGYLLQYPGANLNRAAAPLSAALAGSVYCPATLKTCGTRPTIKAMLLAPGNPRLFLAHSKRGEHAYQCFNDWPDQSRIQACTARNAAVLRRPRRAGRTRHISPASRRMQRAQVIDRNGRTAERLMPWETILSASWAGPITAPESRLAQPCIRVHAANHMATKDPSLLGP
jgi:hypothetical protein